MKNYQPLDRSRLSKTFAAFEQQQQQVRLQVQQEQTARSEARQKMFRNLQNVSTVIGFANSSISLYNNVFRPVVHPAAPPLPSIPNPHTWHNLGH